MLYREIIAVWYMHWNIYKTEAQNLLLHVAVLLGCLGAFAVK
jgi:hypothetical protein